MINTHNIIEVKNGVPRIETYRMKEPVTVAIPSDEPLAIIGDNGSGKSLFTDIITGAHPLMGTEVKYDFTPSSLKKVSDNIRSVTFRDAYGSATGTYYQQRWNQWDLNESKTVSEILDAKKATNASDIFSGSNDLLGLNALMTKKMVMLSSGELRRVQLAEVLLTKPRLIILDNPYIGLDANARQQVTNFLACIAQTKKTLIIVVVSRIKDIPNFIDKVLPIEKGRILPITSKSQYIKQHNTNEENGCSCSFDKKLYEKHLTANRSNSDNSEKNKAKTIIDCNNITISYGNRTILKNFSWSVNRGEHWAINGENGAGKSTLLSLIYADNPQAYACDISLFGYRRGGGESIWDIKKRIGYVSPEMYRTYKKNLHAVDIVASGLHDTIGLYKNVSDKERDDVLFWMKIFGTEDLAERPYLQLSSGEQRMLLLTRAFVKDPELLILDEPFHGLDEKNSTLARNIIDAFCSRHDKTLIMVTHYKDEYPNSIDHTLELKKITT